MNTSTWHMSYYNYCNYCSYCNYCATHASTNIIVKPKHVVTVINYHKFC